MEKKKAMKWVKALRSGKYKQGDGALRTEWDFEQDGKREVRWCCLGILAKVSGLTNEDIEGFSLLTPDHMQNQCNIGSADGTPFNEHSNKIPVSFKRKSGRTEYPDLAAANDDGVSFKAIASYIEKNYEKL